MSFQLSNTAVSTSLTTKRHKKKEKKKEKNKSRAPDSNLARDSNLTGGATSNLVARSDLAFATSAE